MQRALFIDRDGTIIKEADDEKIDSFKKLEFYPRAISALRKIATQLDFELVMITNQDGLGTEAFPEETFWPIHEFIVKTFKNEDVFFKEELIDRTYPEENAYTRKPNPGLLTPYMKGNYDLENSFVIGDRLTDIELAKNIGAKGIFINDSTNLGVSEITVKKDELKNYIALETNNWDYIYKFLKAI